MAGTRTAAATNGMALDGFAITPGAGALSRQPTKGIYIPASASAATVTVKFSATGTAVDFSVTGPGILMICPTHVTAGPSGLVGLV
jgi:hypothetical protein